MGVRSMSGELRRTGQRTVRLQRQIWLAQVAFWPTVVAVSAFGLWVLVRRSRQIRSSVEPPQASYENVTPST